MSAVVHLNLNYFSIVDCIDQDQMAADALTRIWKRFKKEKSEKGEKITQEEFARRCGWTQSTFSGYLNGSSPIGLQALILLSGELNCDPCDIRTELSPKIKINNNLQEISRLNNKVLELKTKMAEDVKNLRDQMKALISAGNLNDESAICLLNSLT